MKPLLFASPLYTTNQRQVPAVLATKVELVVGYVPLPLTLTICWRSAAPLHVALLGEKT